MLRDREWEEEYRTGENNPLTEFIIPALDESFNYWRASGYFSSSVFDMLGDSLANFVLRDGEIDLVTSVHLTPKDQEAIKKGLKEKEEIIYDRLADIIEKEFQPPLKKGVMVLAKLIATNRLNMKIATRSNGRLFHIKMGVFFDKNNDFIAFSGSQNESSHSMKDTFEEIDVFTGWDDKSRATKKKKFFEKLWKDEAEEVDVYNFPKAFEKIIKSNYKRTLELLGKDLDEDDDIEPVSEPLAEPIILDESGRYSYQEQAVDWFVNPEKADGAGLFWMATGTGKTVTSFKTVNRLFEEGKIDHVVINTKNRLLKQWEKEMKKPLPGTGKPSTPWKNKQYWHNAKKKRMDSFRQSCGPGSTGNVLFITYSFMSAFLTKCRATKFDLSRTLLIVDEVHNIGSGQNIEAMSIIEDDGSVKRLDSADGNHYTKVEFISRYGGMEEWIAAGENLELAPTEDLEKSNLYKDFGYRLGLSATPFSDFDDDRNKFILNAFVKNAPEITAIDGWNDMGIDERRKARINLIGDSNWAFYFGLEDAIRRGVLVEFEYKYLPYAPSNEDIIERNRVMKLWKARVSDGLASPAAPAIMMARVFKTCKDKLRAFEEWLKTATLNEKERVLERCLIFVADKEFGHQVGKILFKEDVNYHTYFSGDDEDMLKRFEKGELDNLITCHMISEGVDIQSVSSIILFSSDRQRLETIQRIGRSLRKNPDDLAKKSFILDFIYIEKSEEEDKSDAERMRWLRELSMTEEESND